MFEFIKNIFATNKSSEDKVDLKQFEVGDYVELEFRDPKTLGIISPDTLSFTRLNKDELKNRIIRGCIERILWVEELNAYSVAVKSFKLDTKHAKFLIVREYLFMDYELLYCRLMK